MNKLFILHGWGHSKNDWQSILDRLEKDGIPHQFIELPGFGQEDLVSENWGVEEYAEWTQQTIESQLKDGESVTLLGHSFGGRIAGLVASKQPKWLKALILYGSPNIYRPNLKVKSLKLASKIANPLKKILPTTFKQKFYDIDYKNAKNSQLESIYKKIILNDQSETLPLIKVPCLLLWGEKDEAVPLTIAYAISKLIPKSHMEVIPNFGHNLHLENPNLFYGKLIKALNENS